MSRNYDHTTVPTFNSSGSSRLIRQEFDAVEAGFTAVEAEIDAEVSTRTAQDALKAAKAGDTYTGTHDFSGASSLIVPTPTAAGSAVPKSYADGLAFSTALPAQAGSAGKIVTTDGNTASWTSLTDVSLLAQLHAIALCF